MKLKVGRELFTKAGPRKRHPLCKQEIANSAGKGKQPLKDIEIKAMNAVERETKLFKRHLRVNGASVCKNVRLKSKKQV